jgi:hypothetical protein
MYVQQGSKDVTGQDFLIMCATVLDSQRPLGSSG